MVSPGFQHAALLTPLLAVLLGCSQAKQDKAAELLDIINGRYWSIPVPSGATWTIVHNHAGARRKVASGRQKTERGELQIVVQHFLGGGGGLLHIRNARSTSLVRLPDNTVFRCTWFYRPPLHQGSELILYQETDAKMNLLDNYVAISFTPNPWIESDAAR